MASSWPWRSSRPADRLPGSTSLSIPPEPGAERQRPTAAARNLLHSIARFGTTLVDYGKTQLSNLGDGVGEEINRATEIVIWSALIVMMLGIGLMLAAFTVIIAFWDSPDRLLVAIIVTAGVFALAATAYLILRYRLKSRPSLLRGVAQTALLASVWRKITR